MAALSVVIATKDRPERVEKCLIRIAMQTKKPDEIVMVDGSCRPLSSKILGIVKGVRVIYINRKSSMVEARNIGIKNSSGEIVLFLDDDAFVEKEYIEHLLRFYSSHPEAGGAEGNVTNEKNRRLLERLANFPRFPDREDIMRVYRLHGCNMSFRRKVFADFTFDENLIGYYNDDDEFCGRVSKKHMLFFVPSAHLIHDQTQYGGARTDHYRNYNTMVFNQFYSLNRMPRKDVADILMYVFSQILLIARAFVFVKNGKHTAIKGILRGYERILRAAMKGDIAGQLRIL